MKKVINQDKMEVSVSAASKYKIHAFYYAGGETVWSLNYLNEKYCFIPNGGVSCKIYRPNYPSDSFEEALSLAVNNGFSVYEFDSSAEFFQWAAEQVK